MRRKRTRATWLPVNPTYFGENPNGVTWFEFQMELGSTTSDSVQRAVPLTLDETPDPDAEDSGQHTLRDFVEGQDFILDRVVGKANIGLEPATEGSVSTAQACIAIAVLPTEPGSSQPSIPPEEWNPFFAQNGQQPWLFRRTWMLGNPNTNDLAGKMYPISNSLAPGSLQDGTHVDTKVKRRIRREHRLYIVFGFSTVNTIGQADTSFGRCAYDLRVLGHMVNGKNTSSF